jgi:16S rRNA (guanine966-N2)-methyltransferase
MRIIGGTLRGRTIVAPKDARVRPTGDRVREAWMSILQSSLPGARVLDLYAGSGALGLEALSRGATRAEFVELNPPSLAAIAANIASLGVGDRAIIHRGEALRFAEKVEPGTFDVAFADPPYAREDAAELIALFRQRPFARILALEHAAKLDLGGEDTRRYGDTALTFCHAP